MRRLSLLPLLLALAVALVACGGTQPAANTTPATGDDGRVIISSATGDPPPAGASIAPAPTALPSLGLAVENVQYEAQGNGSVTFTAQIVNFGPEEVRATKVIIDLFDASGERISRVSFSSPPLPALKPGEGASWQDQRAGLPTGWASIRATAAAEPVTAAR